VPLAGSRRMFAARFMAKIQPFRALRPQPSLASRLCELPYDVMSSDEARAIASNNPLSFLHVSKPEIDLPPDTNPYSPPVYAKGRENFLRLIKDGALAQDEHPGFYLYRQVMGNHRQTGLVAVASCQEYMDGVIKKHELTRPDKEDDRVRHMEALEAQTGPAFLTYRSVPELDSWLAQRTTTPPEVDFTAADGVRHSAWRVAGADDIARIRQAFNRIPALYIADGHHRSAAAARVYQARNRGRESADNPSARFLAVIFPHDQMNILAYNRVLKDLNGLTPTGLLEKLKAVFDFKPAAAPTPAAKSDVSLYLEGQWHSLRFHAAIAGVPDAAEALDVALLQKHVLAPLFGVENPRTSERISFVGGIRGTAELEKMINSGEYACAFSMFPTSIEDLMSVADAGGVMPPKSTWFEPKLRDGMFCHRLK